MIQLCIIEQKKQHLQIEVKTAETPSDIDNHRPQ